MVRTFYSFRFLWIDRADWCVKQLFEGGNGLFPIFRLKACNKLTVQ